MRKHIIIILCCIALGGISGTFFWYQLQRFSVKEKVAELIESGIDKEKLVLLKFTYAETKSKLRWEHSKEFEYNNQMYDVVEIEYKEDSVYYLCWHDKEETQINNQLKNLAKIILPNNLKDNKDKTFQINSSKNLYCEAIIEKKIYLNSIILSHCGYQCNYSSLAFTPLTPPPK